MPQTAFPCNASVITSTKNFCEIELLENELKLLQREIKQAVPEIKKMTSIDIRSYDFNMFCTNEKATVVEVKHI